ncbi:MAG: hypothetical protein IBX72_14995 [Nitrospirae bacterium]|nr:hypothetical protein [Nitrospirota bacterium]
MFEIIWKFILGGAFVAGVATLTEKGFPQYAGIIMTFPVITLVSFMIVPESQVISLAKAGIIGLFAAGIFIGSYILIYNLSNSKPLGIIGSVAVWFIMLLLYYWILHRS